VTDWLATCRAAVADVQGVLVDLPTRFEREPVVGRGEGGDETTTVDAEVERVVIALLDDRLDDYTLVSEEIGEIVKGTGRPWLVLDPIDGSLNAKRGVPHF
jgi:myo-inositol-1(or 4)-monophosphatase